VNNSGGVHAADGIIISNGWYEGVGTGIANDGDNCFISNNFFAGSVISEVSTKILLGTYSSGTVINGNVIYVGGTADVGIDIKHGSMTATITGNDFRNIRGTAIDSNNTNSNMLTITGNSFSNEASTGVDIKGKIDTSTINGNIFSGTSAWKGEAVNITGHYNTINGNSFYHLDKALSIAGSRILITSNSFTSCKVGIFGPTLLLSGYISGNYLYGCNTSYDVSAGVQLGENGGGSSSLTVNSGIAKIEGGATSVTINHSLSSAPSIVLLTIRFLIDENCSYWVSNVTATSFDINISHGDNAYFYWYAKV
jgi:hypothetical protein